MKFLIILLLAFLGVAFAADCTTAQVPTVQACYLSYFKKYGLNFMPDYNTYVATAQNYVNRNGINGEKAVQGWIQDRIKCLQPFVPDCVTTAAFKLVFTTDNDTIAQEWAISRPIEDWEFTDGFDELTNNYDCLKTMNNEHKGDLIKCSNNLTAALQNGFSCSAINDYITCMINAYNQYCGKSASDFACHSQTIAMDFVFPQCASRTPQCPGSSKPVVGKFRKMLELKKMHLFGIPHFSSKTNQ